MLRDVQVHLETMTQHNLAVMTIGLMTMLRFLMAELSQTMDMAQVVMNSRVHPDDYVDLVEEEPEPEAEGDGSSLMQGFFASGGRDTMDKRWARAMMRLHRELEAQPKTVRLYSIAALRNSMPAMMMSLSAASWQAQLQAMLVAVQEDSQGAESWTSPQPGWLEKWVVEIGSFIPGYRLHPPVQAVDSFSDREIDQLVQDEEDERGWQQALSDRDAEEEGRREAAEAAEALLCEQETQHLQDEAAEYRQWEQQVEADSLKRKMVDSDDGAPKRMCHMTMEVATGSGDRPRILHTLGFDVPTDGTSLTLRFQASMEPAASEVSTVLLPGPAGPQMGAGSAEGRQGEGAPAVGATSLEVERDSVPNLLNLMEFEEYAVLYERWKKGELTQQEVQARYGNEVMELMLAQEAVSEQADDEGLEPAAPAMAMETTGSGGAKGMFLNDQGVWERFQFGRFEVVYGQWKDGYRSSEQVEQQYGSTWLALFRQWRVWGLDGVWPFLYKVLDVLEDCAVTNVVGRQFMEPETLQMPLKVPWSAVKVYYKQWAQGELSDKAVVERFGEVWLVLFREVLQAGLQRTRMALSLYVEWDVDADADSVPLEVQPTVLEESSRDEAGSKPE